MQCQAQLIGCAVAGVNDLALSLAKSEEGLQLEGAELAGEVLQTQVGGVPALHRLYPSIGTPTIRGKKLT